MSFGKEMPIVTQQVDGPSGIGPENRLIPKVKDTGRLWATLMKKGDYIAIKFNNY